MEEKSVRRTAPEYVQLSFDDVVLDKLSDDEIIKRLKEKYEINRS